MYEAFNFKRIGDVDLIENVGDTAHVIIEESGTIKKMSAKNIGAAKAAGGAIIDVASLPTEDIRQDCIYRMKGGYFIDDGEFMPYFQVCSVDTLPDTGVAFPFVVYYCFSDDTFYGYCFEGHVVGLIGWHDLKDIMNSPGNERFLVLDAYTEAPSDAMCVVLKDYHYMHRDGEWVRINFDLEMGPKISITFDGDESGKPAIDMSIVDPDYDFNLVKVSDIVPATNAALLFSILKGGFFEITMSDESGCITQRIPIGDNAGSAFDDTQFPGVITCASYAFVVYDQDAICSALGAPSGYITNGVYLYSERVSDTEYMYASKVESGWRTVKNTHDNLNAGINTSAVQSMIDSAIGSAIGGSY